MTRSARLSLFGSFVGALLLAIGFQRASGAYTSDFSSHPDEAAHVVSSLLIVDYLQHGFPGDPLAFAEQYYAHFPKVAIGHWPPVFHTLEAGWMLVAGRGKFALVSLLALIFAALVARVMLWTRLEFGWLTAVAALLLLVTPVFMQASLTQVMPDLLLALLAFLAATTWSAYLDDGKRRDVILFWTLTLAAALTNPRGLALALIPLVCGWLTVSNRGSVGRLLAITIPVLLVMCLPTLLFSPRAISFVGIGAHALDYLATLGSEMGWLVGLLALIGTIGVFQKRLGPRWLPFVALTAGGFLFHAVANVVMEARYLVTAAPAVAILAAAGAYLLWHLNLPPRARLVARLAVVAAVLFTSGTQIARFSRKTDLGYHLLVNGPSPLTRQNRIALISGSPDHEGALIAELALRDRQMRHVVLRGSKMLSSSTWAGQQYQLKFSAAREVREYLESVGTTLVISQTSAPLPHTSLLLVAMENGSEHWKETAVVNSPKDVRMFQYDGPAPAHPATIQVPTKFPFRSPVELRQ